MDDFVSDLYDEDSPQYEDDYLALPFSIFSLDHSSSFVTTSNQAFSQFVEEVFAHRRKQISQSYVWVDVIAVNDSTAKRELFRKYFSQKSPERLFRSYIRFYLCFNNWIYPSQPIPNMLKQLKTRQVTLSLVLDWIKLEKLIITDTDNNSAHMYFLVTPDIFYDVLTLSDIGFELLDQETVTLGQDHYKTASAESYRMFQKS